MEWNEFVKNPQPDYPVDGLSYEAYDPQAGRPIEGVFVAGWSREASSGLVGVARKDGENGAKAVLQYLQAHPGSAAPEQVLDRLEARLQLISRPVIRKDDIKRLEAFECAEAERQGLEYYKCLTNEEMLAAIGLEEVSG